jgi:hypothetical protein
MTASIKTIAIFLRPFRLPNFDETLPAGEYEIETQLHEPLDWIEPGTWASSVLVRLHPRASYPGLERTLSVPLADLEHAAARDKLTGKALMDYFLEEMLADPMIRLVMQADGVDESELRDLFLVRSQAVRDEAAETRPPGESRQRKEAGDTGTQPGSARPGTGE